MVRVGWQKEEGYALYLVMVISLFLFLILAHLLGTYVNQTKMIRAKELQVRAENLVLSAVALWTAQELNDQEGDGDSPAKTREWMIDLQDGTVTLKQESEYGDVVVLTIEARVKDSDVKRRVRVTVNLDTGEIVGWRNL
ncbi:hypothetical protein CathTA2_1172 [Caldalkalibacillus thermarum TA2.A1]|uniref:Uncharacterized protein n=1 Tax=Caldalkalibacillus thermarum (strain TA2.A1) TaxID=986075 RepID=F5L5V9_CALTT|nr:competence type IV pilus minor pilin ComGG [Caldalkalibacillus thermarum]EGL83271.1 hypothetical protein CathTA2_1172 [Caldalkalibacillus thermarum TA2.A1]QZT32690.1 hypothetical protein HUR95_09845 [Caldalkalibacillus thermarum TA2.A1]